MNNQLQFESSPYLLQHAGNPVQWWPWGDAAFEQAKAENKPVLVSIGYSSCHWCHVMAHESFEDDETAAIMNRYFINIKVDREEYPDVDHLYMDALQAMTGSGGWPLNVFTTPEKKPFYGGTYFPPRQAYGRASWKDVLLNVANYYREHRDDVETQAAKLLGHIGQQSAMASTPKTGDAPDYTTTCAELAKRIMSNADREEGGFGRAPKFPSTMTLNFLVNQAALTGDHEGMSHVELTLDKMMMGGIYDAVGGGFSRYSTDSRWIVPHFEKMLYDNALLLETYALAFRQTGKPEYLDVITQTIGWLKREMMNGDGGFFSAQDADSEGVEGKFYTWSFDEINTLLGEDAAWFCAYYNVLEHGNWEHTNILYRTEESAELRHTAQFERLQDLQHKLLQHRLTRIAPLTDDKVLLGWNALMNKALVNVALNTGLTNCLELAVKNMDYLLTHFHSDQHLFYHTSRNGQVKIAAYLDDLAFLADALIQIGVATAKPFYLGKAKEIVEFLDRFFLDEADQFYHFTHRDHRQVVAGKKEIYDGALPSSNAVLADVLMYLSIAFQGPDWDARSRAMVAHMMPSVMAYPTSFARWAGHFQRWTGPFTEVSIAGLQARAVLSEFYSGKYLPRVMFLATEEESSVDALRGKFQPGDTLIYLCREFTCLEPFRDVNEAFIEICKPSF